MKHDYDELNRSRIDWVTEEEIDFEYDAFYTKHQAILDYIVAKNKINNTKYDDEKFLLSTANTVEEINEKLFYLYKFNKINKEEYYFLSATIEITINPRSIKYIQGIEENGQ
jgi:hypothetical protein